MNFFLLILLDISASDDDHPYLSIARRPLEALIADWVRQGEEINLLLGSCRRADSAQSSEEPIRSVRWESLKTALPHSRPFIFASSWNTTTRVHKP